MERAKRTTMTLAFWSALLVAFTKGQMGHASASNNASRLALVSPFFPGDKEIVPAIEQRWALNCKEGDRSKDLIDLIMYYSRKEDDAARQAVADVASLERIKSCFRSVRLVCANLTKHQDKYPMGPGHQFYRIFLDPEISSYFTEYAAFAILERDVRITRPSALEELYTAAFDKNGLPSYWVKGGTLAGVEFHATALDPLNWNMLGHINGNALYTLSDPRFKEFVNYTQTLHPPVETSYPFDVALWAVIANFPYSWPLWQRYTHFFQNTDLFTNRGLTTHGNSSNVRAAFVHGSSNAHFTGDRVAKAGGEVDASVLCPGDCQSTDAGAPPAVCDATCVADSTEFRWGGYDCVQRGRDTCRLCYTDLKEALAADVVARKRNARVVMCDARMPPVHPACPHQCGSYEADVGGQLTLVHGAPDTICDMSCMNTTVGHGCGAAGFGQTCRFCFTNATDAGVAAESGAVMCSSIAPTTAARVPLERTARRLSSVYGSNRCATGCVKTQGSKGRRCDPTCLNSPPSYGGVGCNSGSYGMQCRRCYNDIDLARRVMRDSGKTVVMCDTLRPPDVYAVKPGSRRHLLQSKLDGDVPQFVDDLCIFTRAYPDHMPYVNVAAISAREHLPYARIVVAVPASQYEDAMLAMDASLASDKAVRLVPVDDVKHKYSELYADELCGYGIANVLYLPVGAVFTRTPEYLDVRRPLGDLLVSHMSYEKLSVDAQSWRRQNLAILGWPTPCFTHGQDVLLPVSINAQLRHFLKGKLGSDVASVARTLEQFGNSFNMVELLAGYAYGAQPEGVAFQDPEEWAGMHILSEEESVWEIALLKPPYSCRGDIEKNPMLLHELELAARGSLACPHGWVFNPVAEDSKSSSDT